MTRDVVHLPHLQEVLAVIDECQTVRAVATRTGRSYHRALLDVKALALLGLVEQYEPDRGCISAKWRRK